MPSEDFAEVNENVPLAQAAFSVSAPVSLTVAPASQEPESARDEALETSGHDAGAVSATALGATVSRIHCAVTGPELRPFAVLV